MNTHLMKFGKGASDSHLPHWGYSRSLGSSSQMRLGAESVDLCTHMYDCMLSLCHSHSHAPESHPPTILDTLLGFQLVRVPLRGFRSSQGSHMLVFGYLLTRSYTLPHATTCSYLSLVTLVRYINGIRLYLRTSSNK